MNRKTQVATAFCLLSGSVCLLWGEIYLAFVFPRTVRVWEEQARQLNAAQAFVCTLSDLAKHLGFPILGLLMLSIVAFLVWLVVTIVTKPSKCANQQIRPVAGKPGSG